MRVAPHIAAFAVAAAVLLGIPLAAFADFNAMGAMMQRVDAVSSATAISDAPSGSYTIYINRDKHSDADVLANWVTFFSGKDAPLIMEDVECMALAGDVAGVDMAKSLQSRLPANQMKLTVQDAVLGLSKADAGIFDVLVLSDEMASAMSAETVGASGRVEVVHR